MRWQRIARLAIAAIVIVFAAIVAVALRRPAPPEPERPISPRVDKESSAEIRHGGTLTRHTPDGKLVFTAVFESQRVYPDGRNVMRNAKITLPDRNGRTITITGAELEAVTPKEGGKEVSTVKISDNVKLTTDDGLEVRAKEATFDDKTGVLTVPGEVEFTRGRMTGSGVGATYDQNRDVLWLLADAKVNVTPDEDGGGAVEATAGSAGLARADHYVRLTKPAHVVGDGRTADADDITIQLTPDDRLIQTMTLRGNSRITGTPGASAAEGMSARDIDLTYGPDGRTLQQAKLMENAVVQMAGAGGSQARQVSGRTIDMALGGDGTTVTSLNANQQVQLDLPATADGPARRITSTTLAAAGETGIQSATFSGNVVYREMRPEKKGAPAGERTGRSQRLIVQTEPGLGAIQQADFRGNVKIEDGTTTAEGPRALYHVAKDTFDISPSSGDPGPAPSVNDGRVLVHARTISLTIGTKNLKAETDVRSSIQPSKRENGKPASGAGERDAGGKLPALLKGDEPVNVTSNHLDYDGGKALATYTGNAKLFQGQTSVLGDTIVVDDRSGNLTAKGGVRTRMFLEEMDSKTKKTRLVETTATGDTLVYEDAKRLATYTTGPTAKAHIVGTQGDVTADRIQLFLKKDTNELERAEADGNVVVKEGVRTATGQHLTYTPADDKYVMTGLPVQIEERTPTDCRMTEGNMLTFLRTSVDMRIEGSPTSPAIMKKCPAKP
jgi:lipopolysaccharide export system protein LptA